MDMLNFPATGERPLSNWIIILIIVAGLLLITSVIYPYLPKIIAKIKEFTAKKEDNFEDLD